MPSILQTHLQQQVGLLSYAIVAAMLMLSVSSSSAEPAPAPVYGKSKIPAKIDNTVGRLIHTIV